MLPIPDLAIDILVCAGVAGFSGIPRVVNTILECRFCLSRWKNLTTVLHDPILHSMFVLLIDYLFIHFIINLVIQDTTKCLMNRYQLCFVLACGMVDDERKWISSIVWANKGPCVIRQTIQSNSRTTLFMESNVCFYVIVYVIKISSHLFHLFYVAKSYLAKIQNYDQRTKEGQQLQT